MNLISYLPFSPADRQLRSVRKILDCHRQREQMQTRLHRHQTKPQHHHMHSANQDGRATVWQTYGRQDISIRCKLQLQWQFLGKKWQFLAFFFKCQVLAIFDIQMAIFRSDRSTDIVYPPHGGAARSDVKRNNL